MGKVPLETTVDSSGLRLALALQGESVANFHVLPFMGKIHIKTTGERLMMTIDRPLLLQQLVAARNTDFVGKRPILRPHRRDPAMPQSPASQR